jgi:hypothetical protein
VHNSLIYAPPALGGFAALGALSACVFRIGHFFISEETVSGLSAVTLPFFSICRYALPINYDNQARSSPSCTHFMVYILAYALLGICIVLIYLPDRVGTAPSER